MVHHIGPFCDDGCGCSLVVNARVACDPDVLADYVRRSVSDVCGAHGIAAFEQRMQRFRPGRPVPTHRLQPV